MLTNRELATVIIGGVILLLMLTRSEIRESLKSVLNAFFDRWILSLVFVYSAYASLVILLVWYLGLWSVDTLKDTLIIIVFTGFGMVFNANRHKDGKHLVSDTILSTVGLSALLAFYVGLSVFDLWAEIILQLFLGLIVAMSVVAKHQGEEMKSLYVILSWILSISGFLLLWRAALDVIDAYRANESADIFQSLALSIWIPVSLIPLIYILGFLMHIQTLLVHLRFKGGDDKVSTKTKLALVLGLRFSIKYAQLFRGRWNRELTQASKLPAKLEVMASFRRSAASEQEGASTS